MFRGWCTWGPFSALELDEHNEISVELDELKRLEHKKRRFLELSYSYRAELVYYGEGHQPQGIFIIAGTLYPYWKMQENLTLEIILQLWRVLLWVGLT